MSTTIKAPTVTPGVGELAVAWVLPTGAYLGTVQWATPGAQWITEPSSWKSHTVTGLPATPISVRVIYEGIGATPVIVATPISPSSNVVLNATPTGVPPPAGGWKCVMAEGFNPAYPLGRPGSIFAPNRDNNAGDGGMVADCTAFNPNELETFNASQVTLTPDGARLRLSGGPTKYVSGCLSSQRRDPDRTAPGQTGFDIDGFAWLPLPDVITAFEIVITLPANTLPGGDMGWWASSPEGSNEVDFCEWSNYVGGITPPPYQWQIGTAMINHVVGSAAGNTLYNPTQQQDGKPHRWTTVFYGNSRRVQTYLDGQPELAYGWASLGSAYMSLILSHAIRDAYANQTPTLIGSADAIIRSVAVYQDAPHAGSGIVGGGIAAGTMVA